MKTVYIAISADILHHGHINLIKKASEYGDLIVGALTDEAITTYKRLPVLNFKERSFIIENINGVKKVVPQETLDYTDNLKKYKPDYVFHGDDWKEGVQSKTRQKVMAVLGIMSVTLITAGVSLAFFNYTKTGATDNTISTGSITFIYDEETAQGRGITLTNAIPVSNSLGKAEQANVFNFKIISNPGTTNIKYTISARKVSEGSTLDDVVDLYLTDQTNNGDYIADQYPSKITQEKTVLTFDDLDGYKNSSIEKILYEKTITSSDLTNGKYEQDFRLRMWIDENTDFSDGTYNNQLFRIIVNVNANVDTSIIPSGGSGDNGGSSNSGSSAYNMTFTDNDNDGVPSVTRENGLAVSRDEICYGPECFYVLDNDGTNITLLAKYNLKVGNVITMNSKTSATTQAMDPATVVGYGMQDDNVKGIDFNIDDNNQEYPHTYYGTVAFASSNYWINDDHATIDTFYKTKYILNDEEDYDYYGNYARTNIYEKNQKSNTIPTYKIADDTIKYKSVSGLPILDLNYANGFYTAKNSDDTNYSIANYVEDYADFLENTIGVNVADTRLVVAGDMDKDDCYYHKDATACQMYYDRSYWLGEAVENESYVVGHDYGTGMTTEIHFYRGQIYGVRPVIIVPANNYGISN